MKLINWSLVVFILIAVIVFSTVNAAVASADVVKTLETMTIRGTHKAMTVLTGFEQGVSINDGMNSLSFRRFGKLNVFEYLKTYNGKTYAIHVVEDPYTRKIIKVGAISYFAQIWFSKNCGNRHDQTINNQLKEIANHIMDSDDVDITSAVNQTCKTSLSKKNKIKLLRSIIKEFKPNTSYLIKCLNNKSAVEKISKVKSLYSSLPIIMNNYFLELSKIKQGHPSFMVGCEETTENKTNINAKYDDKTRTIIFPVSKLDIFETNCFSKEASITHEYLHHAGIKNENDVKFMDSICAEANNLDSIKKSECKKDLLDNSNCTEQNSACNAGLAEAVKQAVSAEAKVDRKVMQPILAKELKDLKLDDVSAHLPEVKTVNANIKPAVAYNGMPTATTSNNTGTFNTSMRALSSAMQTNMNRIGAAVDKAIEATVQPAVASTGKSTDSTRKTARLDLGSGKSAKFNGVQKIAGSLKSGDLGPDEYIAEEIIADKYGVPVSEVQKIARGLENEAHNKQEMIGLNSRLASNLPSEVAGSAANAGNNSTSSSSAGLAGADSGNGFGSSARAGAVKPGPNRGTASVQDEVDKPSFSGLGQTKELLGLDYQKLRKKYDDPSFHSALTKDNVRIHIKTDGRKIGSRLQDATVYIDSGRSLVRKK